MTKVPSQPSPVAEPRWQVGETPWQSLPPLVRQRLRGIVDNDFSGDPDDLYQLAHHLLSPSIELTTVVGSHLRPNDPLDAGPDTATNAVAVLKDLFARMGLTSTELIVQGSNQALADTQTPQPAPAVDAILAEARREDPRPLYFLAGGGLTDLASALLTDPAVAERMTLVWIGGNEHPELAAPPPDQMPIEYNLLIDVKAAQYVFNHSGITIWQVPRDVYRQCLVSEAELRARVATAGPLGRYLYDETAAVIAEASRPDRPAGETYALGDSPLVLLSALQAQFGADPSSSRYVVKPTPSINDKGSYTERPDARPMRIYTWVDTRLMFEDLYAKLREFGTWQSSAQ